MVVQATAGVRQSAAMEGEIRGCGRESPEVREEQSADEQSEHVVEMMVACSETSYLKRELSKASRPKIHLRLFNRRTLTNVHVGTGICTFRATGSTHRVN